MVGFFGRLRVGASQQVIDAAEDVGARGNGFVGAVMAFDGVRDQAGQQAADARVAMDATRQRVYDSVNAAETAMREELARL